VKRTTFIDSNVSRWDLTGSCCRRGIDLEVSEDSSFDVHRVLRVLGDTSEWDIPQGYRSSLALCVMDSIWSLGIRYTTVERVLDRYLKARGLQAGLEASQSCSDGPRDVLEWFTAIGGKDSFYEPFAEAVENWNRTSSVNGVLKAEAVIQACVLLDSMGINSTEQLLKNASAVEPRWRAEVRGQASGISWKYLLMLAGQSGVKPDRMVLRFMKRMGVSKAVTPEEFVQTIVRSIDLHGIDETAVDHRIWTIESTNSVDELGSLQEAVSRFSEDRDWNQFHSVKNLFLALVGEIGEVAEIIQWKSDEDIETFLYSPEGKNRIGEEIADVFIYLMRFAERTGIDLVQATYSKLALNETKYPIDLARGTSKKYNER
jgi:NTP pyrophosphatase (non-canonical NTP hydrolase)